MHSASEHSLDVLRDLLRQLYLEAAGLTVHELEDFHLLFAEFVCDRASYLIVEVLEDCRHGQHDGRPYFENVLADVFKSAAERDRCSAVYAAEEGSGTLVAVMHRQHGEADVLRTCFKHGLYEHGVEHQVAVREHYALCHAGRTGCEDDRSEVGINYLSVDVAAVSVPYHVAAFFAELLPRNEAGFGIFIFIHVCVDDIAEIRFAACLYALEDLVILVVDSDDCLELSLNGELCQFAFIKLPVERYHDTYAADYREVGFTPLR